MNGDNELFVTAMRSFTKSANASGNRFSWGGKAFFEKPEKPFAGRKSHGDCTETLLFNPEQHFPNAGVLLVLTFRFSVLKVHFHRFPVLPVSANPLCLECRAAAIPQIRFKSSFPPVSGFTCFG